MFQGCQETKKDRVRLPDCRPISPATFTRPERIIAATCRQGKCATQIYGPTAASDRGKSVFIESSVDSGMGFFAENSPLILSR
jgi:hypothetical protein